MTVVVSEGPLETSSDVETKCGVSSTTTEDVSTCSDRSSQGSQPADSGESMLVTVSVMSLDGIVAKPYQPKSKLPSKQKKTPKAVDTTANIVASFSQDLSDQKVGFLTHVPSLPIEMSASEGNPVIKWPGTDTEEKQVLSTVQLNRQFQREKTSASSTEKKRFVPQTCPISISISRHGKLINLGKANLFISGEEKGDATINIPIFPSAKDEKSSTKKSAVKKVKGNKKSSTPMMRIKGDCLQFGLKSDAMLRILVSVADLRVTEREEETPAVEEKVIKEPTCITFNDEDCESVFDDESVEQDDSYESYIKAASESNELRSLRQQLRNSEDIIQNLQAMHETTRISQQEEIERLLAKLNQATQNSETLLQELNQSKSQSEIVPFLETRINDFMEELKKKDTEIACLREEVTEIRKYYKNQVNTLLWDAQDPDNTKAANWKAAIGSAALKATKHIRDREVENTCSSQDEEKKNDYSSEEPVDELLWDNQGAERNRAVNWRAAILKARHHLLERENKQKECPEEIVVTSDEEKSNDVGMDKLEEELNDTSEKEACGEPIDDNSNHIGDINAVNDDNMHPRHIDRAANWKNAIGSAFRRDNSTEKVAIIDENAECQ